MQQTRFRENGAHLKMCTDADREIFIKVLAKVLGVYNALPKHLHEM